MEQNSLWEQVGNRCLELARQELNKETAPTAATVETAERLVRIAIAIDDLNLRWATQTRYGAAAFPKKNDFSFYPEGPNTRGSRASC